MDLFGNYFVDQVMKPVKILEVGQNVPASHSIRSYQQSDISTVGDLNAYFNSHNDYTCRVMSVLKRPGSFHWDSCC